MSSIDEQKMQEQLEGGLHMESQYIGDIERLKAQNAELLEALKKSNNRFGQIASTLDFPTRDIMVSNERLIQKAEKGDEKTNRRRF